MDGVEFHNQLSFLKAGIFYASHVTTVSRTYAQEITTPEKGCGLDGLLRDRAGRASSDGHSQWRGRAVGSAHRQQPVSQFRAGGLARQARQCGQHPPPVRPRRFARAAVWGRLAPCSSERHRPRAVCRRIHRGGRWPDHRHGPGRGGARRTGSSHCRSAIPSRSARASATTRRRRTISLPAATFCLCPRGSSPAVSARCMRSASGRCPSPIASAVSPIRSRKAGPASCFRDHSLSSFCAAIGRALTTFGATRRLNAMRNAAMSSVAGWDSSAGDYTDLYMRVAGNHAPA